MIGTNGMIGMNGTNELDLTPPKPEDAKSAAAPDAKAGYAPVAGLTVKDKEHKAMLEEQVAAKVANDYQHIVWAYGVLWSLFAIYGIFLWWRSAKIRLDVEDLRRALHERRAESS